MANLYDVVSGVYSRVGTANIPSNFTSCHISGIANDVLTDISQFTGVSIDSGDIPSRFMPPTRDFTAAYTIVRSSTNQVAENISIGAIRLEYKDLSQVIQNQAEYFTARGEAALSKLGRVIRSDYTTKVE